MASQSNYSAQISTIDNQIAQLNKIKQQYQDICSKTQNVVPEDSLWSKINNELSGVDKYVLENIVKDSDYKETDAKLQRIIQEELLILVKDKVENREDGKHLLEKQLNIIKNIKEFATKNQQEEMLLFAKFKEYSKLHPDTTYESFLTKMK